MTIISQYHQLQECVNKEVILEGIIQMKKFVNKAGKETDTYEFYIELADGRQILLHNYTGKPLSKELSGHKVHLTGILFYGNIDANGQNKIQSRFGYRLDFSTCQIIDIK